MSHLTKEFVTAGRAVFTIEVPETFRANYQARNPGTEVKPHYTFRVNFKKAEGKFKDTYFLQLLTGPDNTKSYSYLGMLNPADGSIRLTAKSCRNENHVSVSLVRRVLARIWAGEVAEIEKAGFKLHHEGRCGRCGRALTVPESIESGIGPECILKMGGVPRKAVHGTQQRVFENEDVEPNWEPSDDALAESLAELQAQRAFEEREPVEDHSLAESQAVQRAFDGLFTGEYGPYGERY